MNKSVVIEKKNTKLWSEGSEEEWSRGKNDFESEKENNSDRKPEKVLIKRCW